MSLFINASLSAESSKELAMKGKIAFEAFSCSHLANIADEPKEAERLFLVGYKRGKEFIEALRKNKIEQKDVSSIVPMAVTMNLSGPSDDFMLGVIYHYSRELALEDVYEKPNWMYDPEIRRNMAKNELQRRNAILLK